MDGLYEKLVHVPYDQGMTSDEVIDAYMRAMCVAAGLRYNPEVYAKLWEIIRENQDQEAAAP